MNNDETITKDERFLFNRGIDHDDVWQQRSERLSGHDVRSTDNLCTGDNMCSADDMCPTTDVCSTDAVCPSDHHVLQ